MEAFYEDRVNDTNFDTLFEILTEDFPVEELDILKQFIMSMIYVINKRMSWNLYVKCDLNLGGLIA